MSAVRLFERKTLQESRLAARRWRAACVAAGLALGLAACVLQAFSPNRPQTFADDLEHFYYGSIGSDIGGGLPTALLEVLPSVFPEYLPAGGTDYTAFGFLYETEGSRLPIGFSTRRQIIDRSALNCAACHTGAVRIEPEAERMIVPGMPANTVNLLAYFEFLFRCAADHRFNADTLIPAMEAAGLIGSVEKLLYPFIVDRTRRALLDRRSRIDFLFERGYPRFGPGRVNTFDTFKFDQFRPIYARLGEEIEDDELYGVVDFPSVWNQGPREGLRLHWDGNNTSVRERNFSAALGAGARPQDMDIDSLLRVEAWLRDLEPPPFPFPVDAELAERGEAIYGEYCHDCHDFEGSRVGTVIPIEEIGTDRGRLDSYTDFLRRAQRIYTAGYAWRFSEFSTTEGYATQPLDGIWARAPYLHNGSVPTLWDLLNPARERPVTFRTGGEVYDPRRLGFEPDAGPGAFVFDTRVRGNGNGGHTGAAYGTELADEDKWALIEYLKTLGADPAATEVP